MNVLPFYKMQSIPIIDTALEKMRQKAAKEFGATLSGNRLTLRWLDDALNCAVEVKMIVAEIHLGN